MKKIGILAGLLVVLFSCQGRPSSGSSSQTAENDSIKPYMYFNEEAHNLGKVIQGEKVSYAFIVENRGKSALQLKSVTASCGCTVAKYDEKPIAPGKSSPIEVVFNSAGKLGQQTKTVTVVSNAEPSTKILTINCEVVLPNKNSITE
ncbi:MAG: DUF1573 domain-containing protein [Bacteroidota bacterium]|nr:DUF1573 domain-containing protein [Bacteroidota bacterium]